MEEIKVGEYVRYKSGLIRKVSRIIPIYENDKLLEDKYFIEFDGKGDIGTYRKEQVTEFMTKHSPNIIDLIEEGDLICYWYDDNYIHDWVEQFADKELIEYLKLECNEAIKWVATKEKIESIKYEV